MCVLLLKLDPIEDTLVSHRVCVDEQTGTQLSIKKVYSTNFWLTCFTCMVGTRQEEETNSWSTSSNSEESTAIPPGKGSCVSPDIQHRVKVVNSINIFVSKMCQWYDPIKEIQSFYGWVEFLEALKCSTYMHITIVGKMHQFLP